MWRVTIFLMANKQLDQYLPLYIWYVYSILYILYPISLFFTASPVKLLFRPFPHAISPCHFSMSAPFPAWRSAKLRESWVILPAGFVCSVAGSSPLSPFIGWPTIFPAPYPVPVEDIARQSCTRSHRPKPAPTAHNLSSAKTLRPMLHPAGPLFYVITIVKKLILWRKKKEKKFSLINL